MKEENPVEESLRKTFEESICEHDFVITPQDNDTIINGNKISITRTVTTHCRHCGISEREYFKLLELEEDREITEKTGKSKEERREELIKLANLYGIDIGFE